MGNVVWKGKYSAYGQLVEEWHDEERPEISNPLRFQGQYYDEETGLHYNLNRYYDPGLGRYLTADPVRLEGGLNPYCYVDNNPVGWVDPLGLFKQEKTGSESNVVITGEPKLPKIVPQSLQPEFTNDTWRSVRTFKLIEKDGHWYTTSQDGNMYKAKGTYNFVTKNGNIYVSTKDSGHFDISKGSQTVDYAGSLRLGRRGDGRGIIREFSNDSGHYKPDPNLAHQSGLPLDVFIKHESKK